MKIKDIIIQIDNYNKSAMTPIWKRFILITFAIITTWGQSLAIIAANTKTLVTQVTYAFNFTLIPITITANSVPIIVFSSYFNLVSGTLSNC